MVSKLIIVTILSICFLTLYMFFIKWAKANAPLTKKEKRKLRDDNSIN